jgi:hypothetical protein
MADNPMAIGNPNRNPAVVFGAKHAVTATPSPLPAQISATGWVIKAGSTTYGDSNTAVIWVGGADLTNNAGVVTGGFPLAPTDLAGFATIYVCTASGSGVCYSAGN